MIWDDYRAYICSYVLNVSFYDSAYSRLLMHLDNIDFKWDSWLAPLDEDRVTDGINLRYRFIDECNIDISGTGFTERPCSVLEMLIALAIKCETNVACDDDLGDRTGKWFWYNLACLDLTSMDNYNYNDDYVDYIIFKWMNRDYDPDGTGAFVKLKRHNQDLRYVNLWMQMMWYFAEIDPGID